MAAAWTSIVSGAMDQAGAFLVDVAPVAVLVIAMPLLAWIISVIANAVGQAMKR